MINRICPTDEILSEYLSGIITPEDRISVETHLANCCKCRKIVSRSFKILNDPKIIKLLKYIRKKMISDKWLISSSIFLILSFLFNDYFLQFLIAALLTGIKWIIDSKTTKMLIMINEARKDHEKLNEVIEKH